MNGGKSWMGWGVVLAGTCLVTLLAWMSRDRHTPVVVGARAPEIEVYDLQGRPRSLDENRGNVLLMNLWATWCIPCKAEMPSLQRLYDEVGDEGFQVLAVSIDRAPADRGPTDPLTGRLRAFADSLGLTFTILHDPSGKIATIYQTVGVPESFVLDRNGVIVRRITGPMEWDTPQNVSLIRTLLKGDAGNQ